MLKARVMIVEDERIVALHLRQQLLKLGYEVPATAAAGERALEQIKELLPDLVLMDIHIEGAIDGIETASRIPDELQIPVVFLTAYSEESTLERARSTKPYGYLLKPFSERELHATIQMVLERRRADKALQDNEQRLARLVEERTAQLEGQTAERLKAERALFQAQKLEAVGRLTGGIAHDFNNLLMVIGGCLDLSAKYAKDERAHRLFETAQYAASRGQKLIAQLLSFSGRQMLQPEVTEINPLIRVFQDLLQQACGDEIALALNLAPELGLANVDQAQLQSALLNLVINARDAMPDGGRLTIETADVEIQTGRDATGSEICGGSYVMITVLDTGLGMNNEIREHAVEPFFTTKDVGKGSGLGLSQAYGFARQSGGYLQLDSEPGKGTVVELLLPRMQPAVSGARGVEPTSKGAVLVVEDQPEVLEIAVEMLTSAGYRAYAAEDAKHALRLLQASIPIDVLFTDIVMPGSLNGIELAQKVHELRPEIQILLTSGYPRDALENERGWKGDYKLLGKPYRASALTSEIDRAINRRQAA